MKQLSSGGTIFYQVIFPAFALGMVGVATLSAVLGLEKPGPSVANRVFFPLCGVLMLGLYFRFVLPMRHVWLGDDFLRVKGLRHQVEIPIGEIERVTISEFYHPEVITIFLKSPSLFGRKIRFWGRARWSTFSEHPTFAMLAERFNLKPGVNEATSAKSVWELDKMSPEIESILEDSSEVKEEIVRELSEDNLNELIERLPSESRLRDTARRKRQRRWYG